MLSGELSSSRSKLSRGTSCHVIYLIDSHCIFAESYMETRCNNIELVYADIFSLDFADSLARF